MTHIEACLSCSTENEAGYIWDVKNGLPLHTFNQMRCGGKSLTYAEKQHVVISGHAEKSVATMHYATKEQPRHRCNLPEKMSTLAMSKTGLHLAGGGISGKLYLWAISTGALLRIWDGHYKTVSKVAFSADGSYLLSASEDASIKAWDLAYILDVTQPSVSDLRASNTNTLHTLGVTDIHLPSTHGWVVSVAKDRTLRIHDHLTNSDIYCCVLPSLPKCVTTTPLSALVFAGCADGKIYQADLYPERARETSAKGQNVPQAKLLNALLGHDSENGAPSKDAIMGKYQTAAFEGHVGGVTALAISTDGLSLISGGVDGNVNIWQVSSRLLLKSFNLHKSSISSVQLVMVPVKMPSEKESQLTQPFSYLKKNASTGEAEDDYTTLVYHGPTDDKQQDKGDRKGRKRKRGKQDASQTQSQAEKSLTPIPTPTPSPTPTPPPSTQQGNRPSYSSQNNSVDIIARLYNIVSVQQQRIRELEKGS